MLVETTSVNTVISIFDIICSEEYVIEHIIPLSGHLKKVWAVEQIIIDKNIPINVLNQYYVNAKSYKKTITQEDLNSLDSEDRASAVLLLLLQAVMMKTCLSIQEVKEIAICFPISRETLYLYTEILANKILNKENIHKNIDPNTIDIEKIRAMLEVDKLTYVIIFGLIDNEIRYLSAEDFECVINGVIACANEAS